MWIPGQAISQELVNLLLAALNNSEIKAEISKQIQTEIDINKNQYKGSTQTYNSLTSGDVNTQTRMAVSGYDSYGKAIIKSNSGFGNENVYKNMKNKIIYGSNPQEFKNRGGISFI